MIFKKGDKVYDAVYGWGEVEGSSGIWVTVNLENGKVFVIDSDSLSFTEYTLEGFSQERPKEPLPFKVGDVVYLSDNKETWFTTILTKIYKESDEPFFAEHLGRYEHLALDNPLKNPETKIFTKEDL